MSAHFKIIVHDIYEKCSMCVKQSSPCIKKMLLCIWQMFSAYFQTVQHVSENCSTYIQKNVQRTFLKSLHVFEKWRKIKRKNNNKNTKNLLKRPDLIHKSLPKPLPVVTRAHVMAWPTSASAKGETSYSLALFKKKKL